MPFQFKLNFIHFKVFIIKSPTSYIYYSFFSLLNISI